MFALCDVNSFYASCETVFRPDLWGKPVVVASNNDGCVIARSAEAKKLGIPMGAPLFKCGNFFKQNGVNVFSSNYALYADMSLRVMTILEEMAPKTEVYSIDESWLYLKGMENLVSWEEYGREVRERVQREAHLTVGVGISQTKTLAKLANHAAKKWTKTGGVVALTDPARQRKLMALVEVSDVWGVGSRISKRLNTMGIKTALDLANADTGMIRKNFNVVLERTVRELRGESCLELEEVAATKQQIVCSRSYGEKVTDKEDVRQSLCAFAERAAEKLRGEGQFCKTVTIFFRTSGYDTYGEYCSKQGTAKCQIPTNDTRDIIKMAMTVFDEIWQEGPRYAKAGIMLGDFYNKGVAQLGLFDEIQPKANSEALMRVVDGLNQSGKGSLWFAGQGIQKTWQMKREMLSPAYTTRFSDLPTVK
ncbi:translesion error-prone DNA polymerase V subunit UmuC [Pantoea sp. LMR881]|uniref:translesion error-prone DNA polymerase V subunit UmuC n=1 Tax=Pantoea sp. LMR881 TaxID=3014336 RepID=UPI0022AE6125|nr:translesion error-prone DNA polymerase V subunit UmuC [Pantoea sp. LMR881]MCZ4061247.1 translesion error-prone DNA polymerase V subunit UmuC [Pantoea sp. LMR881]